MGSKSIAYFPTYLTIKVQFYYANSENNPLLGRLSFLYAAETPIL